MNKYDMRICNCGRIHMISTKRIYNALEHNKDILFICANCGAASLIGADDEYINNEHAYMMYSHDFSLYKDKTISKSYFDSTEDKKGIEEIIYSHGIKVPMMTGNYANSYYDGIFYDDSCPDLTKINKGMTIDEVIQFINEYKENNSIVNMQRFINETPKDIINIITHYCIEAFNWGDSNKDNERVKSSNDKKMELMRCISGRAGFDEPTPYKLYWADMNSGYNDFDGDRYVKVYLDEEAKHEVGFLNMKHFKIEYRLLLYWDSLSHYVNEHKGFLLKDIITWCNNEMLVYNSSLARNVIKYIKDHNLDTEENLNKEFIVNSIPFKEFENRGEAEKYMDYMGYSLYCIS